MILSRSTDFAESTDNYGKSKIKLPLWAQSSPLKPHHIKAPKVGHSMRICGAIKLE
jgi:hypothetical protein